MKTKVYSAFPGCGKTTYFNTTYKKVLDSDSSKFDKSNFPENYIEHIWMNVHDPSVDKILVSSHKDVREALVNKGIPFVLVYPDKSLKDEYIQRYKERGNNEAFVELLDKNWDLWIDEMDQMEFPEGQTLYKVKLGSGQYLTDVLGEELEYIDYEGYRYWYEYKGAKDRVDMCLATKDPKRYCNGFYLYSTKDPGNGFAFVVVKHNNPNLDW
jgi:hypothetical protein